MQLLPLGDQALLTHCHDEQSALDLARRARQGLFPWLLDVVQAYTSVAFFVDLEEIDFAKARDTLLAANAVADGVDLESSPGKLHIVPCCYELGLDLDRVAEAAGLSREEVVRVHAERIYTVYAIGFCPGFPYMGYLPEALWGIPRLPSPRLRVDAGSVGLTGKQTGIYTEPRPGGWNIVGRTPLELVNVADGYFPLRTGDQVQFRRIDEAEFGKLVGSRLDG